MDEKIKLDQSVKFLKPKIKEVPQVAIILGSGLGGLADELDNSEVIDCKDIPNYPVSTVSDHAGIWVFGRAHNVPVLALKGRVHTYEGYSARTVTYSIRLMAQLGIKRLVVTNASGGVNPDFQPGDLMLITDQINWMFDNPLIGDNSISADQRFIDMSEAYDKIYLEKARAVSSELNIELKSGILFTSKGPTYETAAEVRMAQVAGADSVTMSTTPEVIVANQMKMRVMGISCITNLATGISKEKLNHGEVQETANRIKETFLRLMKEILTRIPQW